MIPINFEMKKEEIDEIIGNASNGDEFEEQEVLVYMNFDSEISPSELDNPNLDIKIIGIDSDGPIVELNGKLLKGTYDLSIGTHVFFEKDTDPSPLDPLYDINPQDMYKYITHTAKVLKMKRLFVKSKNSEHSEDKEESVEDIRSRLEVNMNYGEALNLLLPPGAHPPRRISANDTNTDEGEDGGDDDDDDDDEDEEDRKDNVKKDPDFVPSNN